MLNQIVYTRCSPYRDLKRNGQIIRGDGLGVFSFSRELLHRCSLEELTFINNRLAVPNAAKENAAIGLFNSYEYTKLPDGQYALTYEVARPLCKEPRKNGRLHRGGTFIKQCLVGEFHRRVTDFLGSTVWDAHLVSENDYYMDNIPNPEPPFLDEVDEGEVEVSILNSQIDDFIYNGREEMVSRGICFLVEELDKKESDQKVLIIKDNPDNVSMWVLAFTRIFPEYIANKITFSTNVGKLSNQIDSLLFYYTDQSNKVYTIRNQADELIRHPYCAIVGYHPDDVFSASLRQTVNSNFYIIDGVAMTTTIPDSYTRGISFSKAAMKFDEAYQDFSDIIIKALTYPLSFADIVSVHEVYQYVILGKPEYWDYEKVVQHFGFLMNKGVFSDDKLNGFIVQKLTTYIMNNFDLEIDNSFHLSVILWEYSCLFRSDKEFCSNFADKVSVYVHGKKCSRLEYLWQELKAVPDEMLKDILNGVISGIDTRPQNINRLYEGKTKKQIYVILEMLLTKCKLCSNTKQIFLNDDQFVILSYGICQLYTNQTLVEKILFTINRNSKLFIEIVRSVAGEISETDPDYLDKWWETVVKMAGSSVIELCAEICENEQTTINQIEELLCYGTKSNQIYDENICQSFIECKRKLPSLPMSGKRLFSLMIDFANENEFSDLIQYIGKANLDNEVEKILFELVDNRLGIPDNIFGKGTLVIDLESWAAKLGEVSKYCAYCRLANQVRKAGSVRKIETISRALDNFRGTKIPYSKEVCDTKWYDYILKQISTFYYGEIYLKAIWLFVFSSEDDHNCYIQELIYKVLSIADKHTIIDVMLSICQMICDQTPLKLNSKTKVLYEEFYRRIEYIFEKEIEQYYSNSMIKNVKKNDNFDEDVKEKMIDILNICGQKSSKEDKGIFQLLKKFKR